MGENQSVVFSFQDLREVQQKERGSDGLTQLPEHFYRHAAAYVSSREDGSRERENADQVLTNIIDLRLKKIVDITLVQDTENPDLPNLTAREEELLPVLGQRVHTVKTQLKQPGEQETREKPVEPVETRENTVEDGYVKIRVDEAVPAFLGIDLKSYGPYGKGEDAVVPVENANVLVHHGRATILEGEQK